MGREAACHARQGRESGEGHALLETDELIFRGAFRAKVPLREIASVTAKAGVLCVKYPGGTLALELGEAAAKWAAALANPKSLLDKLGVKPGLRVVVLGVRDAAFLADLATALGAAPAKQAANGSDLVFLAVGTLADHAKLARLVPAIRPAGAVWAIYPKGRKAVSEGTIRAHAKQAGLVDVKIARFSATHGAVKLVVPKSRR